MNDIAIDALQSRLKTLDAEYVQNRKVLVAAIQRLAGRSQADKSNIQVPIQPKNGSGDPRPESEQKVRSLADAIRIGITETHGEFSVKEMRDYLAHRFPDIYRTASRRSIGARLWEHCHEGVLGLISPGKGGKPNIYIRKDLAPRKV